jgi:DUF1009 family protein
MVTPAPKLGIIAGGGMAPKQLIAACQKLGRNFFIVCLEGQADADTGEGFPRVWLPLGAANALKQVIIEQQIKELVMLGRVRRPSLFELKPDKLALKVLTKIGMHALGDDGLLSVVGKAMEAETGVRVIGAHEVFGDLLAPSGVLTKAAPDALASADIERGIKVARDLGRLDIGQAVVVQQGLVLGVEGIEGTDGLITRCGALQREGPRGVLVKVAKPQQDQRFDLPAIGPRTVETILQAGLRGIVVEAKHSLLLEREKTVAAADAAGIFIVGVEVA